MGHAAETLTVNCVKGITANVEHCRDLLESSVGTVTAVCPHIGYAKAAKLAKESLATGTPIRQLLVDSGTLTKEECDRIMDAYAMTAPGINEI